jgi:hypothetical protein
MRKQNCNGYRKGSNLLAFWFIKQSVKKTGEEVNATSVVTKRLSG